MPRLIQSLSEISAGYDAVFCDLWGCLHDGVRVFPAAVAALQGFRAAGGRVILLTNAPRPEGSVRAQLARLGAPEDCYDAVVTSGDAAQVAMVAGVVGRRVHHIGAPKDLPFFTDLPADLPADLRDLPPVARVPLDQAEGIVCTGPVDELTETPEDYRSLFAQAIARGMPLLCANPDLVVDLGERRIFCAGALAALYTEMGGKSLYFGKPHVPIYDLARRRLAALGAPAAPRILAVGDGVGTDVAGGVAQGLDVLFVTGGLAAASLGPDADTPDPGLIAPFLAGHGLTASHAIGKLR